MLLGPIFYMCAFKIWLRRYNSVEINDIIKF